MQIDGTYMDRSLNDFAEECVDRIEVEEANPCPDTSLIVLLADAVRLTREMTLREERYARRDASVAAWLDQLIEGRVYMSSHTCHALGCITEVPEAMWGCSKHWYMVPKPLRDAIWRTYRKNQEVTKNPSAEYIAAAKAAIAAVAAKERRA